MKWKAAWSMGVLAVAMGASASLPSTAWANVVAPKGVVSVQQVEGISEFRLANGLQVLLIHDGSKPSTTVNLTFKVGSRHENYGETGMAHLLEHLIFKGTPKHPTVWQEFTQRGLRANGTTWLDRTNYFASFATNDDNLRWYLGWLADAMVNSYIARKDLDTEMTVVRNEMEMGENEPSSVLFERTLAGMYQWHNYGKSTIGARTDVENVDIPSLQAFYRMYYQPDNATLIVSGRMDPSATLAWIQKTFGAIPKPKRKLPTLYTLDPVQDGEREVTVRRVGGIPLLMVGYHIPPGAHPDFPAAALLGSIMSDVPSGRLHKALVETQKAASVFDFSASLAEPGFSIFGAQLTAGGDLPAARQTLLETLESVKSKPVTAEELERARTRWLNRWETQFTDPEAVGQELSEYISMGDWRLFFMHRDRIKAMKLEDVQRVASQYLVTANRTLAQYVPTEAPLRAPAPANVDVVAQMKDFKPAAAQKLAESFEATPANIDARTRRSKVGGLQVALLPKSTRGESVHAQIVLRFGDAKSLQNTYMSSTLMAAVLDKGTKQLSRQQVQDRLDALKTQVSFSAGVGSVTATLQTRKEHLVDALKLVTDILREPTLAAADLKEVQRQFEALIDSQRKEPGALANNHVRRTGNPWPRGDVRYEPNFDEMMEDLRKVDDSAIKGFHQRFLAADRGEVSVVGDFDPAAVLPVIQSLSNWKNGSAFARVERPIRQLSASNKIIATPDKQNANMVMSSDVALQDTDADYPAAVVANYMFGSGGSSRLWKRIREKEGLSYDVRSGLIVSSQEPSTNWTGSAIFAPQNRAKVEAAFREEWASMLKDGFRQEELDEARKGLLSFRRLSRAQDGTLVSVLANNAYLQRDMAVSAKVDEAIEKLTLKQVNEAARRYFNPDKTIFAWAGDFKE